MSVRNRLVPPSPSAGGGMGGRNHDCRARDIKRRLEVIQKKMADLQELGVPCAFCHISIRNTGTLFTMGNKAMTDVIESCQDAILDQLSKSSCSRLDDMSSETAKEVHMLLPPLPGPLDELGLHDLRALVVGIIKDLGIKWSNPRPPFWPQEIPFQYPRSVPDGFQGCWTKALRQIVRSIYAYFNYNPDTHTSMKRNQSVPFPPTSPFVTSYHGNHLVSERQQSETRVKDEDEDISSSKENLIATYKKLSSARPLWMDKPNSYISNGGNYTVITQSDDNDSNETISVCSDPGDDDGVTLPNDHTTVSYFGYEIANSESSRSSPHGRNDHDDSPTKNDAPLQPRLVYCDPRFYGQLYPTLQLPAPLLIQPNVFMKQIYTLPSEDTTTSTPEAQKVHNESSTISSPKPLTFSFSLPKSTQPHTTHTPTPPPAKKPTFTHTPSPYEAKLTTKPTDTHTDRLLPHSNNKLLPDSKSRKGKNGIYIYTNPTAPLKFMSLNSKKQQTSPDTKPRVEPPPLLPPPDHIHKRKIMTTIAPPISPPDNKEPMIAKDSGYHHLQVIRPDEKHAREESLSPPQSGGGGGGGGDTLGGSRKNPHKRRRELVFHWYHSPETQGTPGATVTKRPKSVDAV